MGHSEGKAGGPTEAKELGGVQWGCMQRGQEAWWIPWD